MPFDSRYARPRAEVLDLQRHREQAVVVRVEVVGDRRARLERLRELHDVVVAHCDEDAAGLEEIVLTLVEHRPADHVDIDRSGVRRGRGSQA